MRNDLELGCAPCGLRLPRTEALCPSCGRKLVAAQHALTTLRAKERPELDPVRTLITYIPAAAGGIAITAFAVDTSLRDLHGRNALNLGIFLVGVVAIFAVGVLALILLWLAWAGVVHLVFSLLRRRALPAPPPLLLIPLPFAELGAHPTPLSPARKKLGPKLIGVAILLYVGLLLIADLLADKPSIDRSSFSTFVGTTLLSFLAPLAGMAIIVVPLRLAFSAVVHTWEQIRDAVRALHGRKAKRAAWGKMPDLAAIGSKSAQALGRARLGENTPLIAPLSGKPCIAFRLVGRIGELAIDDGDAKGFLLETDERTIEIRGQRFAVALPVQTRSRRELDPTERERIAGFFSARGLAPTFEELELGESCVFEGDRIEVLGELTHETAPQQGYRGAPHRQVIHEREREPILITTTRPST